SGTVGRVEGVSALVRTARTAGGRRTVRARVVERTPGGGGQFQALTECIAEVERRGAVWVSGASARGTGGRGQVHGDPAASGARRYPTISYGWIVPALPGADAQRVLHGSDGTTGPCDEMRPTV